LYDYLRGQLVETQPGYIILDVGGIGFKLIVPDHTVGTLGNRGSEIRLWTYLHFKEDNISLYGFADRQERDLFLLLLKVSGIGPRSAIQILSGIRPEELVRAMVDEDWKRLTLISGIGPKTARRLLIELKEKLTDQELLLSPTSSSTQDPVRAQAFNALVNLGFEHDRIRKALKDVPASEGLEDIIRTALTRLSA
jgi:Holliday junction DNA helicase RuvA